MGGREDTAAATAPAKPEAHSEAATDVRGGCSGRDPKERPLTGEGAKGPFTKGLRSYIQECPWQGQGRARAVLSNHGDGPWAPS